MLFRLLFSVLCLFWGAACGQSTDGQQILEWNEFYHLQWEDFQGRPTAESIGDAGTVVQTKANPYLVKKRVHYNVYAYFDRSRSWVRDKSKELLAHEQLHFDIAELYARKIRKLIAQMQRDQVTDVSEYNAAIHRLLEESNEYDRLYDIQTLHGAMSKKQQEWVLKVETELESLKEFRKQRKIISPN